MSESDPLMINFDEMFKREPMDREYEDQAMGSTMENRLLMTAHSQLIHPPNSSLSMAPYHMPPTNLPGSSHGTKAYGRNPSYFSDTVPLNGGSLWSVPAKDNTNIFKSIDQSDALIHPASSMASSENSKFTRPIPGPLKSPAYIPHLPVSSPVQVDSGGEDGHSSDSASVKARNGSLDQPHYQSPSPPQRQTDTPTSTGDVKKKPIDDRAQGRRCQICNDNASGFHYGVWSCEGCKAFFKRSLQGPVDYVCPSTNTCTIDKQRRKSCQACRLRKCKEMGMSRGNCRKERKPSLSKGPKRKADSTDSTDNSGPSEPKSMRPEGMNSLLLHSPWDFHADSSASDHSPHLPLASHQSTNNQLSTTASLQHQYSPSTQVDLSSASSSSSGSSHHHMRQCSPPSYIEQPSSQPVLSSVALSNGASLASGTTRSNAIPSASNAAQSDSSNLVQESSSISTSQLPIDPLVEHLLRIDPPIRASGYDSHASDSKVHLMTSLMRLADTELVDIINWAKSIPGYAELDFQDRVHLLELCWMEIIILGILWRTHSGSEGASNDDKFIMGSDLVFDRSKFEEVKMWSIACQLQGYLQEMSQLHVNQEEFVLLRALVLINSDRSHGRSGGKISGLRGRILQALHYTTIDRYHGQVSKVMNLLTLLPHIRQLGQQWIAHYVRCTQGKQLHQFGLLKEMIDAYLSCVDLTCCEAVSLDKQQKSQESRSNSLEPNGTISASPSLSPISDVNG